MILENFFSPNNQLNNFKNIVVLLCRLFYIDHSAVKYILINYFIHQYGDIISWNSQIMAKILMNINIFAIIWQIIGEIIQLAIDWDKN